MKLHAQRMWNKKLFIYEDKCWSSYTHTAVSLINICPDANNPADERAVKTSTFMSRNDTEFDLVAEPDPRSIYHVSLQCFILHFLFLNFFNLLFLRTKDLLNFVLFLAR